MILSISLVGAVLEPPSIDLFSWCIYFQGGSPFDRAVPGHCPGKDVLNI